MKYFRPIACLIALCSLAGTSILRAQVSPEKNRPADEQNSAGDETLTLSPFTVTTARSGYGSNMGTSGRLATPYLDTPQAASIVTSDFLRDAILYGSNEALWFVPSIKNASQILNSQVIRGFSAASTYNDGFRNTSSTSFDTFFADRIEVVKGPSSASFGRGDPSGFINYVSKRPLFNQRTELSFLWGSGNDEQDTYRAMLDHNGVLSELTAYRFAAFYEEGAQSMGASDYKKSGAHLAVAHNFKNRKGRVDVFGSFMSTGNPGVVNRSDMSRRFYRDLYAYLFRETGGVNVPDFPLFGDNDVKALDGQGYVQDGFRLTAILDYKLTEQWRTRQAFSYLNFKADGAFGSWQSFTVTRASDGTFWFPVSLTKFLLGENRRTWQSDFLGEYDLGQIGKFSLVGGGDVSEGSNLSGLGATTTATSQMPLFNWNPHLPVGPWLANPDERGLVTKGWSWSYYAQGQLKFLNDRLQATAAARKLYQDTRTRNRANNAITKTKTTSPVMPTYSLLFKPRDWMSFFVSASEYLEPAVVSNQYTNLAPDVPANDPRRTATLASQPKTHMDEFGAKLSLPNGRLSMSLTYFNIEKTGSLNSRTVAYLAPDGTSRFYSEFFKSQAESSGWEIEGFGQVSDRLTFLFGGVFGTDSSILGLWKNEFIVTPINDVGDAAYAYANYNFGRKAGEGFKVTAGWRTQFSGWSANAMPDKNIYPDDETIVDFGLAYGFRNRYEVSLKVNNAFHEGAVPFGNQSVISGRQIYVGLRATY
ncbi:MAG: TonB-dependent receptor [Opitutaceae bacterium]|nr:TonB-dependent receptor [Opitutaceae bacterium]